jgi:hypothetical protein
MWNRRDLVVLATAAVATFGLTVATLWPRSAHAVGETPSATTDVPVPTLNLGNARVTAAMDASQGRTVILTVRNLTAYETSVSFTAGATVIGPTSALSRGGPIGREAWKQEYALKLQADETKSVAVELPEAAFVQAPKPTPEALQVPALDKASAPAPVLVQMPMTPGFSYLTLSSNAAPQPQTIQALKLPTLPAETLAAAKSAS